jgi:CheY-like chemotaxis protein
MAGSPSMLAAELPDAILLDLMPEMDDFELVVALQAKAAWREIPVGRRYRARPNGG